MRQRFNEDKGLRRGVLLGCMILTITSISLFAASFKYISELQYCIRYNTVTQEMDENLYMDGEPGTYFEIVSYAFTCYPRTFVRMRLAGEGKQADQHGPTLSIRSKEGLRVKLDVDFEYSFRKDSIRKVYDLLGSNTTKEIHVAALSALHRSSSKYTALQFLSPDRVSIRDAMLEELKKSLSPLFVDVKDLHLFHVTVSSKFQGWIQAIQNIKLLQEQAIEVRTLEIAGETNALKKATIDLDSNKETILIDAAKDVASAKLQQDGALISADTEGRVEMAEKNRSRLLQTIVLDVELQTMKKNRAKQLVEAESFQQQKLVEFQKEHLMEESKAKIALINAEKDAAEIRIEAAGNRKGLGYEYAADLVMYKSLKTGGNFSNSQILQYMWINLHKKKPGMEMFVDYKKVPLMLEGMKDVPAGVNV